MHRNHYYEPDHVFNLNAALDTVGGVAGQFIQAKQQGAQLSAAQQQTAAQALAIQQALAQQQQGGGSSLKAGGITTIALLGGLFLVILFVLFKMNKK